MTIRIMDFNRENIRTFDNVTDYDLTNYPIIELTSEIHKSRVVMKVPDTAYVAVIIDESEEQNES